MPLRLNARSLHANPWAIWRPGDEAEEMGQWCIYPACPRVDDDGDNVLVSLNVPSAVEAYVFIYHVLKAIGVMGRYSRLVMAL
jgi:hypothetical protein